MNRFLGLLSVVLIGQGALALDGAIQITAQPMLFSYSNSGYLHNAYSKSGLGLAGDLAYPLSPYFQLKGFAMMGLTADFLYIGPGIGYQFRPANLVKTSDGDSIEFVRYRKWRPYVDIGFGQLTQETNVVSGRLNEVVREQFFGFLVKGGAGYAIDEEWEMNANIFYLSGSSDNLSSSGYGISFGVRLNLF